MGFCKKLGPKIKTIVKKVDEAVNKYSTAALSISGNLKKILVSPVGDMLTELIPGDWDNEFKAKATDALTKVINGLSVAKEISNEPDLKKKLEMFVTELGQQHPEYKEAMLFKVASLLTKYMHDGVLTASEYDIITQAKFMNLTKPEYMDEKK